MSGNFTTGVSLLYEPNKRRPVERPHFVAVNCFHARHVLELFFKTDGGTKLAFDHQFTTHWFIPGTRGALRFWWLTMYRRPYVSVNIFQATHVRESLLTPSRKVLSIKIFLDWDTPVRWSHSLETEG